MRTQPGPTTRPRPGSHTYSKENMSHMPALHATELGGGRPPDRSWEWGGECAPGSLCRAARGGYRAVVPAISGASAGVAAQRAPLRDIARMPQLTAGGARGEGRLQRPLTEQVVMVNEEVLDAAATAFDEDSTETVSAGID